MRHFTIEELKDFASGAGLEVVLCEGWMTQHALQPADWYGFVCARKP
jgi:hypothetical protein